MRSMTRVTKTDLARLLLGAAPDTKPQVIASKLKKNPSTRTVYSRVCRIADAFGVCDVNDLFANYRDTANWIARGVFADGTVDPTYNINSQVTKRNMACSLLRAGKLDAIDMTPEAESCLNEIVRSDASANTESDIGESISWEGFVKCREENIDRLSREDALMVWWWTYDPAHFPPRHLTTMDMGNVILTKITPNASQLDTGQIYLVLNLRYDPPVATIHNMTEKTRVPDRLAKILAENVAALGWRKWLFQSRSGKKRPLKGNACSEQLAAALYRMTGHRVSLRSLKKRHAAAKMLSNPLDGEVRLPPG